MSSRRIPHAAVQATRDGYVDAILTRQNADGGWSLGGWRVRSPI